MAKSKRSAASKSRRRCKPAKQECRVCGKNGAETFNFLRRSFVFDVDRAREITQDGRKPIELDRSDVFFAVDTSRIYIEHVPHVTTRFPGIVARVRCTGSDGSITEGDLLIDGHHRAAKCLQTGKPYMVYRMTPDETDSVLITRPDKKRKAKAGRRKPDVAKKQRRGAAVKRRRPKTKAAARQATALKPVCP